MNQSFPLQIVLELMQSRADKATQQLAGLIANERDARSKLEMLRQYRDEYAARFRKAAEIGLSPREWSNYQEFIHRLDEAIAAQSHAVDKQIQHTADGQARWQEQRKKLKAMDTLSARHRANTDAQEQRRQQKAQDEFAIRARFERGED